MSCLDQLFRVTEFERSNDIETKSMLNLYTNEFYGLLVEVVVVHRTLANHE